MKTVAPQYRSLMPLVSLATAVRSKRWFEDTKKALRKFRAGGRCGTIHMTIESFARKVGEPHERAGQYRDFDGDSIDRAGKVPPLEEKL